MAAYVVAARVALSAAAAKAGGTPCPIDRSPSGHIEAAAANAALRARKARRGLGRVTWAYLRLRQRERSATSVHHRAGGALYTTRPTTSRATTFRVSLRRPHS